MVTHCRSGEMPVTPLMAGIGPKDLDGDRAVEAGIESAIDNAHPTLAELGFDLVGAEGPPDH